MGSNLESIQQQIATLSNEEVYDLVDWLNAFADGLDVGDKDSND